LLFEKHAALRGGGERKARTLRVQLVNIGVRHGNAAKPASADADAPPDPTTVTGQNSYFVQVAAVSKQEDAAALVDALKKKQYAAFAASAGGDKLFHVQVGPFSVIKDAESARGQLVKDGYNPILKK
jgi:cell division septation protein DedD